MRNNGVRSRILSVGFLFFLFGLMNAVTVYGGTATLSWTPPTTNEDGTALMDLAGYKIYYGTASGNYTNTVDIGNRTTYQIANLTDGITYYFTVTAYNIYGSESVYSPQVSKTIPAAAQYNLTVSKTGTGAGTVTSTPAGISCGSSCSAAYPGGTIVTLIVVPDVSSTFVGWSGACTGTGTCSVTMDTVKSITASFTRKTYAITASAGAGGSITPSGSVSVNHGASQTFTITPNAGYTLSNVLVDGASVGAVSTYTLTNVTAGHTISASFAVKTYTITASAGAGGSITPSGAVTANHGSNGTFTITPNLGYGIADVLVDGVSVGAVSTYTFTNIIANHTISASFTVNAHTITVTAGTNGTITPSGPVSVSHGASQTFTITPNTGYTIANVLVDGVSVGVVSTYTFSNVTAAHTISVSFALTTYTITSSAGTNGTITPGGAAAVTGGASQTFMIAPAAGYHITDVQVDGVSVGAIGSYMFTNVIANHTISASFAVNTYTITATAGTGGSISPSGTITMNHGASQTFTFAPHAGYAVASVLIDGTSVGPLSTYIFTNITANHTISANFGINLYSLAVTRTGTGSGTVSSTPGGITCGSTCSAAYTGGTIVTLTAVPDASSTFVGWTGACTGTGACSVTMDAAKNVTASFALKTCTITATAGSGGTIAPAGVLTVNYGSNGTFTITPNAGYMLSNVIVDGVSVGAVSAYTFAGVIANHSITASFTLNTYSLAVTRTGSGTGTVTSTPAGISCGTSCSGTYAAGTAVTLTASPASNSLFNGWSGACTGTGGCSLTMDAAKTVYPLFTLKPVFSMTCPDAGNPCVERVGGGSDADNLVNGKPRTDVVYEFSVMVKDTGGTPQSVRFLTAQRSTPQPAELAAYPMTCNGDFGTGAVCAFRTKLGPAALHRFFFEATMSDGTTIMRYPQTGLLPGPSVKLLTGYNILGTSRNVNAADLNGLQAFNSANTYRWHPDLGYYTKVTTTNPVRAGEGYFSYNVGNILPELAGFRDVPGTEYAYQLKAGWNLVSNPFSGNVRLADIKVQRGTAAPVTWQEATANGWITNALYTYTGSDWGKTYSWESDVTAILVPWMGYTIYLNTGDSTYSLLIPRP